jgi:acetylornithine deacetylase/succinyl-diaminopimelate desuccinylase-like protein
MVDASIDDVVARIDKSELVRLTLDLCTIDSSDKNEAPVAELVADWLEAEGFRVRKLGLLADRYNVLGTWRGTGGGCSLIFNSHMDTSVRSTDTFRVREPDAPMYHSAWIEGDEVVGNGVANDKGPMAAFLIAAKAVKASGMRLRGDLLLSAVVGETSHEPVDGPPGEVVESQDLGARWLVTHGGVADYAFIAEGTGFSIVAVEAGMAWYKITWISDQPSFYTPYLPDRTTMVESPNMIVRAALGIEVLERWAADYQRTYTYQSATGLVVPKAQIGAIRSGSPTAPKTAPQICSAYLGAYIVPGQDPIVLRDEMSEALAAGGAPAEIELYLWKPGYEAKGAERLIDAVEQAHRKIFGDAPPAPNSATCSMWRDINCFNEVGVPAITYGPRSVRHAYRHALTVDSLYQAACVYALTIVDLCNRDKAPPRNGAVP